jgi:hypothetical protein
VKPTHRIFIGFLYVAELANVSAASKALQVSSFQLEPEDAI